MDRRERLVGGRVSARLSVVDSDYGHDAFLVEPDAVGPPIASFLANDWSADASAPGFPSG